MVNGFTIFGIKIYFYAIIIITGALLAAVLASREAKRRGLDGETIWDILPWVLIAGIIGARLWHVFTPPESMLIDGKNPYFIRPLDILNIRNGGLGIPGAVIGGAVALWIYARKKKISFLTWVDIIAPGLALAQAVGRWGNFFNQEVYGLPSTLPWAIKIDVAHRLPEYVQYETYHPTFLYESLWNILNMVALLWIARRFKEKLKPGDVFLVYLVVYAIGRFLLEFIRIEYSPIGGINFNQTFMAVIGVVALFILLLRHLPKKRPDQPVEPQS